MASELPLRVPGVKQVKKDKYMQCLVSTNVKPRREDTASKVTADQTSLLMLYEIDGLEKIIESKRAIKLRQLNESPISCDSYTPQT